MSHKNSLQALNQTLHFFRGNDLLMDGIIVALSGDFQQTLPAVLKGKMANKINACLKSSHFWRHDRCLRLTKNMSVYLHGNILDDEFAHNLLNNGNRLIPLHQVTGLSKIRKSFCSTIVYIEELLAKVLANIRQHFTDHKLLW